MMIKPLIPGALKGHIYLNKLGLFKYVRTFSKLMSLYI